MPTVRLRLNERASNMEGLPEILKTKSGTLMLEIQGVINVGSQPLIQTELNLGMETNGHPSSQVTIGDLDLSKIGERGSPVNLVVGETQMLKGTVVKLDVPLAIMDVSDPNADEIDVLAIITHKVIFSKRPEPLSKCD